MRSALLILAQWTRSSLPEHDDGTGQAFTRIRNGQVAVLVVGDRGPCFTALEQHLRAVVSTGDAPHAKAAVSLLLDRALHARRACAW